MDVAIDGITALERSYEELNRLVAGLSADQLASPTGCPDWDVRTLLNHILGAALVYVAANAGETAGEDGGDVIADDPQAAVIKISTANLASWRAPGALEGDRAYPWGRIPAAAGLVSNVGEVALHSYDLARATDQEARLDPNVAQLVYDFYTTIPMDGLRDKGAYGPEVPVPETGTVQDRLLGLLGRAA